jgi:predicted nucleic acid-binding Zn ribbon protein
MDYTALHPRRYNSFSLLVSVYELREKVSQDIAVVMLHNPDNIFCIVVTASVKEDERVGQGHTSANLLHQSATRHRAVNIHCFYMTAFSTLCLILSVMDGKIGHHVCIKFRMKLGKSATKPPEMLRQVFGEHSVSRIAIFEWHSRFMVGQMSAEDD